MTYLKKKLKAGEEKTAFVGAYLPLHLNSFVTMFSLATGNPKAGLIVAQMEAWQKVTMKGEFTIELLIETLVNKALEDFQEEKKTKPNLSLSHFCTGFKNFLIKKGIEERCISLIITGIRYEAKKI